MVQSRNVDIEDLFDVIRKIRLLEEDPATSLNRETKRTRNQSHWKGCCSTI